MNTLKSVFGLSFAFLMAAVMAAGGEIGHYAGGIWGPWDHISPAPGSSQFLLSFSYYTTDTIKNASGESLRGIDANIDVPQLSLLIGHTFEEKILGSRYAVAIIPSYGESSVSARLASREYGREKGAMGWTDLYVIPGNMTWDFSEYFNLSAQYSFWAPTGAYRSDRNLNNGLGYWSHDFRLTGSYFPTGKQDLLLSASVLYELNGKKRGVDVHPGDHLIMEIGTSYVIGKHLIPGIIFAGNWEVSSTTGAQSTDRGKDRVFSIGPEVYIPIVPNEWTIIFRYMREFSARDRSEGNFFYALLEYQF